MSGQQAFPQTLSILFSLRPQKVLCVPKPLSSDTLRHATPGHLKDPSGPAGGREVSPNRGSPLVTVSQPGLRAGLLSRRKSLQLSDVQLAPSWLLAPHLFWLRLLKDTCVGQPVRAYACLYVWHVLCVRVSMCNCVYPCLRVHIIVHV